jgi:hypothetical protein
VGGGRGAGGGGLRLSKYYIMQVVVPPKLQEDLKAAMSKAGIPVPSTEERWDDALNALRVRPEPCLFLHYQCSQ